MDGDEVNGQDSPFYDTVPTDYYDTVEENNGSQVPSPMTTDSEFEDSPQDDFDYEMDLVASLNLGQIIETRYLPAAGFEKEEDQLEKPLPPTPPPYTSTLKREEQEVRQKKSDLEAKPGLNRSKNALNLSFKVSLGAKYIDLWWNN